MDRIMQMLIAAFSNGMAGPMSFAQAFEGATEEEIKAFHEGAPSSFFVAADRVGFVIPAMKVEIVFTELAEPAMPEIMPVSETPVVPPDGGLTVPESVAETQQEPEAVKPPDLTKFLL